MIVSCTACSVRYLVDPRVLGTAGRAVRCARCGHTWHQAPPADAPQTVDLAPLEPALTSASVSGAGSAAGQGAASATPERVQLPAVTRRPLPWKQAAGVLVLAVAVVAVLWGAVAGRGQVTTFWPGAARLYGAFGFPTAQPGDGLALIKVMPSRTVQDGQPTLVIDGQVTNTSGVARDVPKLRVILRDGKDQALQSWTFPVTGQRLLPGGSVPFHTSIAQPAAAATGVVVTFAAPGDG